MPSAFPSFLCRIPPLRAYSLPVNLKSHRQIERVRPLVPPLALARRALEIRDAHGTQFYDSLMLAAAESAGCGEILTEDLNDGQLYGTVKAVNPFKGM